MKPKDVPDNRPTGDSNPSSPAPSKPATALDQTVASTSGTRHDAAPLAGKQFGDYEILEEIARGGMGVVFKARHTSLNRLVALKMILSSRLASKEDLLRFQAEAEAAAKLSHPGIVPIYEVGQIDGLPYFCMELVEGGSLADRLQGGPLPQAEAARMTKLVAEAVQYAHSRNIVHRDLKPANILLDESGSPKVTDFGLAKNVEGQSDLTATGQIMGTPGYMAPEQAAGNLKQIGPLSDVYSLGAILYQLLTGQPPFQGDNMAKILTQVLQQEPSSPRRQNPAVDLDLETICMKCLEKDAARRYASAGELAAELDRYLKGQPIQARSVTPVERCLKWVKRNPIATGFYATAITLLLTLSVGGPLVAYRQAELRQRAEAATQGAKLAESIANQAEGTARAAEKAAFAAKLQVEEAREIADRLAEERRRRVYATTLALAQREWEAANVERVIELLRSTIPQSGEQDLRGFEWYYLWRLCHGERQTLAGHGGPVRAVAFSPDGQTLVTAAATVVSLWDLQSGRPQGQIPVGIDEIWCLDFAPDGQSLAVGGRFGDRQAKAVIVDLATREARVTLEDFQTTPSAVFDLTFSPDGNSLATGTASYLGPGGVPSNRLVWIPATLRQGEVRIWDSQTGQLQQVMEGRTSSILGLEFAADAAALIASGWDGKIRVWDPESGKLTKTLAAHDGFAWSVAFSPDGSTLASCSGKWDGEPETKLWSYPGLEHQLTLRGHATGVTSLAFSPDGKSLATTGWDRKIKLWDVQSGREQTTLNGHRSYLCCVAFSPDGQRLATGSWDRSARIWYANQHLDQTAFVGPEVGCYSVAFSPDDDRLAFSSPDVQVMDTASGEVVARYPITGSQEVMAYSPDGTMLATASLETTAHVRNAVTGELLYSLSGHESAIWALAFSPDSQLLATGSHDNTVRLWNMSTGEIEQQFEGSGSTIRSLAFTPDNKQLAGCCHHPGRSAATDVRIWDVVTGEMVHVIRAGSKDAHTENVECVAFSANGRFMATCGHDRTARLWNTSTWQLQAVLKGHLDSIYGLAISSDDRTLATASWDGSVKLWSTDTGEPLLTLGGNQGVVYCVGFSHDGRTLVAGSGLVAGGRPPVRQLKFWHAATEQEVAEQLREHRTNDQVDHQLIASVAQPVRLLHWSADGKLVYSGGHNAVSCYQIDDGKAVEKIELESMQTCLAVSSTGKVLATGDHQGQVSLWSLPSGTRQAVLQAHEGAVTAIAVSADGKRLATGGVDQRIVVWDGVSLERLGQLGGHRSQVSCLTFSADGTKLISGSWDTDVKVWDLDKFQLHHTLTGHQWGLVSLAISPNQKLIAAAGGFGDPRIIVWDIETGETRATLIGHLGEMTGLTFASDSKRILSISQDHTLRAWDVEQGRGLGSVDFGNTQLQAIARSPSGESFAVAQADGHLSIWNTRRVLQSIHLAPGPQLPRIIPPETTVP